MSDDEVKVGDGDHERTPPQQLLLVAAIAVLAIVLALMAAAAAGPWEWPAPGTDRSADGGEQVTQTFLPTPPSQEEPAEPEENAPPSGDNPLVRWLVIATVAAIGVLILFLALRLGLMLRRGKLAPPDPRQVSTPQSEELIDAPAIQEGIAAAQGALAEDRPPRDAIVRAWLALETAAGDAGVTRRPAQTPTEFATLVLARTAADADSVQVLRTLYTRSRFSEAEITQEDAEQARTALKTIAASWSAVEVPS